MKILTLWAEATVKPAVVLLALIAILMIGTSDVFAYNDYAGCDSCHGGFLSGNYVPPSGDPSWGDSLHDVHRNDMLGGANPDACNVCHNSGGRGTVFIDSSTGGNGLAAISCVGCHGRDSDGGNDSVSPGRGAGLRQHHTRAGESDCTGCHTDAVLANYTPEFENVLPNYYANPGTGYPNIPSSSCNGENFAGSATGLDNDGNGSYDVADPNCPIPVELMIFEIE